MEVNVGGITFSDGDDQESTFLLVTISGWFDGVDTRREKTPRPRRHGAFKSPGYQGGRIVSLELEVYTSSKAEQRAVLSSLAALLADGGYSPLTVTEDGQSWSISVGRDGEPTVTLDMYGLLARVRLQFWAPDSRWYEDAAWQETGPPEAGGGLVWPVVWPAVWPGGGSSGRVSLVNSGLAPSAPSFLILGGFSSALITCVETGERIGFDRPIPVGSIVDIDVAGRRAMIDGQSDVSRWLRWREWGDVPPESTRQFQFDVVDPSGSPKLQGRVLPAWW